MNPSRGRYIGPMTGQHRQILTLIAEGLPNAEIGATLYITEDTVKSHVRAICKRLGARNRAECVHRGYQAGYLTVDQPAAVPPPVAGGSRAFAKARDAGPVAPPHGTRSAAMFQRVGLIQRAVAP